MSQCLGPDIQDRWSQAGDVLLCIGWAFNSDHGSFLLIGYEINPKVKTDLSQHPCHIFVSAPACTFSRFVS